MEAREICTYSSRCSIKVCLYGMFLIEFAAALISRVHRFDKSSGTNYLFVLDFCLFYIYMNAHECLFIHFRGCLYVLVNVFIKKSVLSDLCMYC